MILKKRPRYDIIKRITLKIGWILGFEVSHSYVFKRHPIRSLKNDREDYAFCENCKKFAWETGLKSRKCKK